MPKTLLKPPPLFTQPEPPPEIAAGPTDVPPFGRDADPEMWDLANGICNDLFDARTADEVEAIKTRSADSLRDLAAKRRDLAQIVSDLFADRRRVLGGAR